MIQGWNAQALELAFGFALALAAALPCAVAAGDEVEAGTHMRRFLYVTRAVAWRSIHNTLVNPAILVPSIIFPLFFLVAFAGGLSRISDVPNFHYKPGYTSFQFVFVFLQSAAFGGVFTGFAVARDFQSGFARRLMLGAPRRSGIIAGYVAGALMRWLIVGTVVTIAGADRRDATLKATASSCSGCSPRRRHELHRCALGDRDRDVPAHRAGGPADPDAGVRGAVPRAGVRARCRC